MDHDSVGHRGVIGGHGLRLVSIFSYRRRHQVATLCLTCLNRMMTCPDIMRTLKLSRMVGHAHQLTHSRFHFISTTIVCSLVSRATGYPTSSWCPLTSLSVSPSTLQRRLFHDLDACIYIHAISSFSTHYPLQAQYSSTLNTRITHLPLFVEGLRA